MPQWLKWLKSMLHHSSLVLRFFWCSTWGTSRGTSSSGMAKGLGKFLWWVTLSILMREVWSVSKFSVTLRILGCHFRKTFPRLPRCRKWRLISFWSLFCRLRDSFGILWACLRFWSFKSSYLTLFASFWRINFETELYLPRISRPLTRSFARVALSSLGGSASGFGRSFRCR